MGGERRRKGGGGREEGKRKNRPWQQIGITAHVTGCTVTVSVPFSNRIAASLHSRVLTIQQNRTFLLLSLSMFRDFSPGDSVLFPFHKHPRMDLSFSRSCARARVYTRISLERIESIWSIGKRTSFDFTQHKFMLYNILWLHQLIDFIYFFRRFCYLLLFFFIDSFRILLPENQGWRERRKLWLFDIDKMIEIWSKILL